MTRPHRVVSERLALKPPRTVPPGAKWRPTSLTSWPSTSGFLEHARTNNRGVEEVLPLAM